MTENHNLLYDVDVKCGPTTALALCVQKFQRVKSSTYQHVFLGWSILCNRLD